MVVATTGDGSVSWTLGAALSEGHRLALLQPRAPPPRWQGAVVARWGLVMVAVLGVLARVVQWGVLWMCGGGRGGLMKPGKHDSPRSSRGGGGKLPRTTLLGWSMFGKTKS